MRQLDTYSLGVEDRLGLWSLPGGLGPGRRSTIGRRVGVKAGSLIIF